MRHSPTSLRRTGSLAAIALVSLSIALAGCTSAMPDAAPTPSAVLASPAPTVASPTPEAGTSSEPPATPVAEPPAGDVSSEWTLSAVGYGPLRIGDPFDPATAEVGSYVRGRECADPEYLRFASDEAGSMAVVLDDGMTTIESIWVSVERGETTGPATESGVRPGSDLATLLAAHPDATLSRELPNGGTYAVASGPTFLTFAVDDGIVRAMAAATSPSPFREYCA